MNPILMFHRTYLFRSCSLCIAGQSMEASATCSAETEQGPFQPHPLHSPVIWSSKSILWGQLPNWHALYTVKVPRGSEVLEQPQITWQFWRGYSLRGKNLVLHLPHYSRRLCNRIWEGWATGFQIPAAQGGMGWRKGNEHQHFILCSLLKPLTVAERPVNSAWAWSPLPMASPKSRSVSSGTLGEPYLKQTMTPHPNKGLQPPQHSLAELQAATTVQTHKDPWIFQGSQMKTRHKCETKGNLKLNSSSSKMRSPTSQSVRLQEDGTAL